MLATFGRRKEQNLWFPILSRHGFSHLSLSSDKTDQENAIDAVGFNKQHQRRLFALRSRTIEKYTDRALAQYKREFTIRYSRPSSVPVEWQKLFEMDMPITPHYFCYGWCNRGSSVIEDYVILDISILKQLYSEGHLDRYTTNLRTNIDRLQSKLAIIPIQNLIDLPSGKNVVAFHSENHPGIK